jgi:tRNA threonylcarbamoyladenosine biosynthesis protein TsaB
LSIDYYYPVIVLALDTTTPGGSCALARDGVVSSELVGDPSVSQASRLPADLMRLLAAEGVALADVDAYAVATGPGSFTGLRVGIATMQALAFSARKPLVGVSGLDALAAIGGAQLASRRLEPSTPTATWVDAWRGEIYAALYENGRQVEAPAVEAPQQALTRLRAVPTLFIGDGALLHADLIRAARGETACLAEPAAPSISGAIAALATATIRDGHRPAPDEIRPLYVRRSDAELMRDARAVR